MAGISPNFCATISLESHINIVAQTLARIAKSMHHPFKSTHVTFKSPAVRALHNQGQAMNYISVAKESASESPNKTSPFHKPIARPSMELLNWGTFEHRVQNVHSLVITHNT